MNLIFACLCVRTGKSTALQQEKSMIDEDTLRSIEKLHEMKANGIISEAEFEETKQKLLSGTRTAKATATKVIDTPAADKHFDWMVLPLRRYAQFTGRSSRKEFWMFLLFTNAVSLALGLIWTLDTDVFGQPGPIGNLALALLVIGVLGVIVPVIAVEVRRFHDQGKSGWFSLLNLIPYIGPLIVLGFMLVPGTAGDNEYGEDPTL
jgi:uncharacterized membrane protein YhaH (DUF805 family)